MVARSLLRPWPLIAATMAGAAMSSCELAYSWEGFTGGDGGDGGFAPLVTTLSPVVSLSQDGFYVYFTSKDGVGRISKDNGSVDWLVTGSPDGGVLLGGITVDDGGIAYYTTNIPDGAVRAVAPDGATWAVTSGVPSPFDVALVQGNLYFTTQTVPGHDEVWMAQSKALDASADAFSSTESAFTEAMLAPAAPDNILWMGQTSATGSSMVVYRTTATSTDCQVATLPGVAREGTYALTDASLVIGTRSTITNGHDVVLTSLPLACDAGQMTLLDDSTSNELIRGLAIEGSTLFVYTTNYLRLYDAGNFVTPLGPARQQISTPAFSPSNETTPTPAPYLHTLVVDTKRATAWLIGVNAVYAVPLADD
jgi:hypothetical protein